MISGGKYRLEPYAWELTSSGCSLKLGCEGGDPSTGGESQAGSVGKPAWTDEQSRAGFKATERVLIESGRSPDWGSGKPAGERSQEDRQTPVDGRLEPTGGPRKRRGVEPAGGDSVTWERGRTEAKSPGTSVRF